MAQVVPHDTFTLFHWELTADHLKAAGAIHTQSMRSLVRFHCEVLKLTSTEEADLLMKCSLLYQCLILPREMGYNIKYNIQSCCWVGFPPSNFEKPATNTTLTKNLISPTTPETAEFLWSYYKNNYQSKKALDPKDFVRTIRNAFCHAHFKFLKPTDKSRSNKLAVFIWDYVMAYPKMDEGVKRTQEVEKLRFALLDFDQLCSMVLFNSVQEYVVPDVLLNTLVPAVQSLSASPSSVPAATEEMRRIISSAAKGIDRVLGPYPQIRDQIMGLVSVIESTFTAAIQGNFRPR